MPAGGKPITGRKITAPLQTLTAGQTVAVDANKYDRVPVSASGNINLGTPTGTATEMQRLAVRIKNTSGGSINVSCAATYRGAAGVSPVYAVPAGKTVYIGCLRNAVDATWDVAAPPDAAGL